MAFLQDSKEYRITIDDLGLLLGAEKSALELAAFDIPIYCSWVTNYHSPTDRYFREKRLRSGLHFNILEGPSELKSNALTDSRGCFSRRWIEFLYPTAALRSAVEAELEFQLHKATQWFGKLSHVDSHLHLHSIPWINRLIRARQAKHGYEHVRNAYEPLFDGCQFSPKLLLLRTLQLRTKCPELPCYGIGSVFQPNIGRFIHIVSERQSPRELVCHPVLPDDNELDIKKYRFVDPRQLLLRNNEHCLVRNLLVELSRGANGGRSR